MSSEREMTFRVPDPGLTFLAFGGTVSSGVGIRSNGEEPQPQVMWNVDGKWSKGAKDNLDLMLSADVAEEIGQAFLDAAKASREDLADYNRLMDGRG